MAGSAGHLVGAELIAKLAKLKLIMEEPVLNAHNKEEYPPMHTAEHILNGTMVKLFGCPRSRTAHIERKKSKCDYLLDDCQADCGDQGHYSCQSGVC